MGTFVNSINFHKLDRVVINFEFLCVCADVALNTIQTNKPLGSSNFEFKVYSLQNDKCVFHGYVFLFSDFVVRSALLTVPYREKKPNLLNAFLVLRYNLFVTFFQSIHPIQKSKHIHMIFVSLFKLI